MKDFYEKNPPHTLPSLVLAYLGDAVYELQVRNFLVTQGLCKVDELHRHAVQFVNASTQAKILHAISESLTEDESAVVRRGRNAKSGSVPKNTSVADYRHGTAFEALIGYLYSSGKHERLNEIFIKACEVVLPSGEENTSNEGKAD